VVANEIERTVMRKVQWRLLPFLVVCYLFALIDRTNVGMASLQMTEDIGLTKSQFAFGASLFFVSYFLVEVPSNLALEKFGARRWIARIMITWGLISAAMAFVQGATSFYVLRFILGAAEAGFFPGRLFSRHHPVPHLLASAGLSWPYPRDVRRRHPPREFHFLAALGRVARHGRHMGAARLALAIHP